MMVFFYISCVVLLLYVAMVMLFLKGWRDVSEFMPTKHGKDVRVSVIVCCRNEEDNLPRLLASLAKQSYANVEYVLVDDHSTDGTLELLRKFEKKHDDVKVIKASGEGKKSALREAVEASNGELICCTDADCELNPQHVQTVVDCYETTHADMILGGVKMRYGTGWFEKLQALEFLTLIVSGAGATGMRRPILANGANMAFTRVAWEDAKLHLHEEMASGDDMFLLQWLKKRQANIVFLKSENALVTTATCSDVKSFFAQRARWTSKSAKYRDGDTILVALLVFLTSMMVLAWGVAACCGWNYLNAFVLLFFLKYIVDTMLMREATPFFREESLCKYTLLLSVFYPLYVLVAMVMGSTGLWRWKR